MYPALAVLQTLSNDAMPVLWIGNQTGMDADLVQRAGVQFAGIPSARIPLIPREQQFAEKIHAYTLPREGTPNSRTRDLIDLVLLIDAGLADKDHIKTALHETFKRRKTHKVPSALESPSAAWEAPYAALAKDCGVSKKNLGEAFDFVKVFWDSLVV